MIGVAPSSVFRRTGVATDPARREPVRVCFLIDDLAKAGTETQLLALIRELDRGKVQPYLCLLRGQSELSRSLEPADCPILRLGVGSLRSPRAVVAGWQLGSFLRRERIDVLQAYFPDSSYLGVPVARLAGVPFVIRTRNNLGHWLTPLHRFLGRMLNPLTTLTIANCEAARQALIASEKPNPERVIVLENGVDLERFECVSPLRQGPLRRVGVVANLRPVKGLDVFVATAGRVIREFPDAMFQVAGEGSEREALLRQANELGLGERFHLCGSITDVPGFLAGIDVAVLSSRAEGMSNAVLEYMAAGRAIVATDVGANSRLIEQNVHGFLVPPGDPEVLSLMICWLMRDDSTARRLARAARRRVEDEFSRQAMVRRFEEFYQRLVKGEKCAHGCTTGAA
jgi:glycosyltransferase involved in cell wall biosynthesis